MRYNQSIMGAFSGRLTSFLGGVVFNKDGTARTYNTPVNPQSASQILIRALFEFLNTAWAQTLSQAQRDGWESARLNNPSWTVQDALTGTTRKFKSAKAMFISVNTNLQISTGSLSTPTVWTTSVPAIDTTDAIGFTSLVADASAGSLVLTYAGALANEILYVRVTNPVSPGNDRLTSVKSFLRSLLAVSGASPVALGAEYVALFGAITSLTGEKIFYTIEAIGTNDGRKRLIASGSTVIVA